MEEIRGKTFNQVSCDLMHKVFKVLVFFKDVPGGFPKSDLLGVTVALIHVVGQQFLAV